VQAWTYSPTMEASTEIKTNICDHCNNLILKLVSDGENNFCCHGCRLVYKNLLSAGLGDFYKFRDRTLSPVKDIGKKNRYNYLNDNNFQTKKMSLENGLLVMKIYVEGVHCQACLWILEGLPERLDQVKSARFSISNAVLELRVVLGSNLAEICEQIHFYGYVPQVLMENVNAKELRKKEARDGLVKLGVAFFCTGNIMLLSVSTYAGADGDLRNWFDWISFLLCIPVVTFCSLPFYRASTSAIRRKSFSIDISIALAIIFGFLASSIHVINGRGDIYFDTIAMLVFLLLGSRKLLSFARERGLGASEARSFYSNMVANRLLVNGEVEQVHTSLIEVGDKVEVMPGEIIPVDGIVTEGESYVNESIITGESFPVRKIVKDLVSAGGENQSSKLVVETQSNASDSKMGQIIKKLEESWGSGTELARLADNYAKVLVGTVLGISLVVLGLYSYWGQPLEGVTRALAMIIITCPCALGFNLPIALLLGMRKFAGHGIILKEDSVVEKTEQVEDIFLDKTGTVTSGGRDIVFHWSSEVYENELFSLESYSSHPLAGIVTEHLDLDEKLPVKDYQEIPGVGPQGRISGSLFQIMPSQQDGYSFSLFKDGELVLNVEVEDVLDETFSETVRFFKSLGKKVYLLSGDKKNRTLKAANLGGVDKAFFEVDPIGKSNIISKMPNNLMLGDGVNDALALKKAHVGVAASGGVDLALASADVYFCRGGLENLKKLFIGCQDIVLTLKANIACSILYNIVFVTLALLGLINPLAAAVLMPVSSVTLLLVSILMLKRMDNHLEQMNVLS